MGPVQYTWFIQVPDGTSTRYVVYPSTRWDQYNIRGLSKYQMGPVQYTWFIQVPDGTSTIDVVYPSTRWDQCNIRGLSKYQMGPVQYTWFIQVPDGTSTIYVVYPRTRWDQYNIRGLSNYQMGPVQYTWFIQLPDGISTIYVVYPTSCTHLKACYVHYFRHLHSSVCLFSRCIFTDRLHLVYIWDGPYCAILSDSRVHVQRLHAWCLHTEMYTQYGQGVLLQVSVKFHLHWATPF